MTSAATVAAVAEGRLKSAPSSLLDASAISLSGLCLAHCLALPLVAALRAAPAVEPPPPPPRDRAAPPSAETVRAAVPVEFNVRTLGAKVTVTVDDEVALATDGEVCLRGRQFEFAAMPGAIRQFTD